MNLLLSGCVTLVQGDICEPPVSGDFTADLWEFYVKPEPTKGSLGSLFVDPTDRTNRRRVTGQCDEGPRWEEEEITSLGEA
jgi:hypothetical protein